jgi:photosystem II stability/assembly factor-like uncharacterized protein
MKSAKIRVGIAGAILLGALSMPCAAAGFADPLEVAPGKSSLASTNLLNGLGRSGTRIVAVGQRGHIVVSGDAGKSWTQATVPVSSDLVAVYFPTAAKGWAVGHDGVVLATADGGDTWTRQFDGRAAGQSMAARYAKADPALAAEGQRFLEQGPDKPFLDVWFEDENTGYVVGAFNLIFRTEDGGKSWQPWFDRTDNPNLFNLYAIRPVGDDLFIAGEQGLLLKLDRQAKRFRAIATPYKGSYFGITGKPGIIIVYGLRGNVYRSTDGGANWTKVETGMAQAITASAIAEDGRILLATAGGAILSSSDDGASFKRLPLERTVPAFAVLAQGKDAVIVAGNRGVRVLPVKTDN